MVGAPTGVLAPTLVTTEPAAPQPAARGERVVAALLLWFTLLFALVVQSLLFHRSGAMRGDVSYHRGVAFSMTAGDFQGAGPLHHLLSYFGGLYPLTLGFGSRWLGVSFDELLSVVSWPATVALPLALWWLGRRIWPGAALEPAVLAFLGTVGSSLGGDPAAMWVRSVLLSGANLWPLYPRDVALVLVIAALAVAMRPPSWRASVLAGVLAGTALCLQAQFGVYAVVVVAGYGLWRAWPERAWGRSARESVVVAGIAAAVSAWWWWPRLRTYLDTGRLLLRSYPGATEAPGGLDGIIGALGILGLLAVPGVVLALRRGHSTERFAGVWLLLFAPIVVLGGIVGDTGVLTARRVLFLAGIPLAVSATIAATRLLHRVPLALALPVLVIAVVIPSVGEASWARDRVSGFWVEAPTPDPYATTAWSPVLERLRDRVQERGSVVVIAPDNDAEFLWERTGAQPFSLWLPGWVKLGFPPEPTTGLGYLTRVRMLDDAFVHGLPGLCRLARTASASALVLRRDGPLIGTFDVRPSARWRVDPADRTERSIRRNVGPAATYLDQNETEVLAVARGSQIPLGWDAPGVRVVDVELQPRGGDPAQPEVVLRLADGERLRPEYQPAGPTRVLLRYRTPHGIATGTRLEPRTRATVSRIIGYEAVVGASRDTVHPALLDPKAACRGIAR